MNPKTKKNPKGAGREPKATSERRVLLTVRITPKALNHLKRLSILRRCSKGNVIEMLLAKSSCIFTP